MGENKLDLEQLEELVKISFGVTLNLSDFFHYATADSIIIDYKDLHWVLPIYKKYGYTGLDACVAYIAKKEPIKPWITEEYVKIYKEIEELNPEIHSEY